jgi:membrane-associated phospholipid phosphatase
MGGKRLRGGRLMLTVAAGGALAVGAVPTGSWVTGALATTGNPPGRAGAVAGSPFAPGTGQLVVDWNKTLISVLGIPGAQPATVQPTRSFAILQAAEYDAVASVTRAPGSRGSGQAGAAVFTVQASGRSSAAAAADQAAHDVLTGLYPGQASVADGQLATQLAAIPDGRARDLGITVGHAVAARLLAQRAGDGSAAIPGPFVPGSEPGDYQLTPPNFPAPAFTNWGSITPFVLQRGSQFRPGPPPPVTSAAYAQALAVTASLGQDTSTTRTASQTSIGRFWGAAPVWNVWNEVAQDQATARRLSLVRASALFATLDLALGDTSIGLYDAKYHYQVWRPVTAIRAGVPGLTANPGWLPLTSTSGDPSYPSGHSSFSFAAATVLSAFFGNEQPVTVRSDALPGQDRDFKGFIAAATEAALSRIYAGQHTPVDDHAGRVLGASIAGFVLDRLAQPRPARHS